VVASTLGLEPIDMGTGTVARGRSAAGLLIEAIRQLAGTHTREGITDIVKRTARKLVGADGATFVLRDNDKCFYVDEDAISPLWQGQRFPLEACISGWAMLRRQQVVIPDIFVDPRIPIAAYRPTFVKSLVMTPVRHALRSAAIGTYWASFHQPSQTDLEMLQDLADATSIALENADLVTSLEQRVEARTRELLQANRDLEAFSYTVAHDLRAPLATILGYAELFAQIHGAKLDDDARDMITAISHGAERMNGLIEALLRLSQQAKQEPMRRDFDMSGTARVVLEALRLANPGRTLNIEIEPGMTVNADPDLLHLVVQNLLGNAVKYSSKREVSEVRFSRFTGKPDAFAISDNGAGFNEELASNLFTPFRRLHSSQEFAGIGVGLATVARIIRNHGGEVWAQGSPGKGATFFFTLPESTRTQELSLMAG
jgi:signal transduction histidine kinase